MTVTPVGTVVSTHVVLPVLFRGGATAIWVKLTPSVDRWTMKPVSVVALSRQVRLTCGPACSVAVRLVGAAGALTPAVADTDWAVICGNSAP